jgi:hypothetical protein
VVARKKGILQKARHAAKRKKLGIIAAIASKSWGALHDNDNNDCSLLTMPSNRWKSGEVEREIWTDDNE